MNDIAARYEMLAKMRLPPGITFEELQAMHAEVGALHPPQGSEAYRLLCSLVNCLRRWPVLKRRTVAAMRDRYRRLYLDECDD